MIQYSNVSVSVFFAFDIKWLTLHCAHLQSLYKHPVPTQSSQNADLLFQTNVDSIRPYSPPSNYREEAITATGRLVPGNRIEHDKMVPSSNITEEEKRSSIGSRRKKDQKDRSEDIELGERKVVIVEVKKLEAETVNEQENATKG